MQTGFDGIVHGIVSVDNCVMLRRYGDFSAVGENELMCSFLNDRAFFVVEEKYADNAAESLPCCVVRIIGVGLVGGGVLCKALKALHGRDICFFGASVSECGISLALPREKRIEAVNALSRALLFDGFE